MQDYKDWLTDKGFKILIASDPDHEKVFAEIYYENKFVALVSQEEGLDKLKIELPDNSLDQKMLIRAVNLEGFQKALQQAIIELKG